MRCEPMAQGWLIREANIGDAAAIARVQVDSWRTTYQGIIPDEHLASLSYERRAEAWQKILSDNAAPIPESLDFSYVALNSDKEIIGFAGGGRERSGDPVYKGELYCIYLLYQYQRKGGGQQLTSVVAKKLSEEGFDSMLVWVLAENPARRFYQALGGKQLREQNITIGGAILVEVAYGWTDLKELVNHGQG